MFARFSPAPPLDDNAVASLLSFGYSLADAEKALRHLEEWTHTLMLSSASEDEIARAGLLGEAANDFAARMDRTSRDRVQLTAAEGGEEGREDVLGCVRDGNGVLVSSRPATSAALFVRPPLDLAYDLTITVQIMEAVVAGLQQCWYLHREDGKKGNAPLMMPSFSIVANRWTAFRALCVPRRFIGACRWGGARGE